MNIWAIKQNLLSIFEEIEDNGGELTPDLEKELTITQEVFANKVKDYTCVIKSLTSDLDDIKLEQKRLKELYENKEKTIAKLKEIIIDAIEQFGDTNKSGVKYVDYGTGKVSVRKSTAVEVDDDCVKSIGVAITELFDNIRFDNMLDVYDKVDIDDVIQIISEDVEKSDGECIPGYTVSKEELDKVNLDVTLQIPASKITDAAGYQVIKEILKLTKLVKMSSSVSKSLIKNDLVNDGSCLPHIAKLKTNKNITIK